MPREMAEGGGRGGGRERNAWSTCVCKNMHGKSSILAPVEQLDQTILEVRLQTTAVISSY
jgi:hypothetical protein